MKRCCLILLLWTISCLLLAQNNDWQEALHQWMTTEDVEQGYSEETMEQLADMAEEKLNLNQTTREQLEQFPFLTAQQIEELTEYLDRYRPMRSLSELYMIRSLDPDRRKLLCNFVTIGEEQARRTWPSMKEIAQWGKHTLTATAKIPLYERRGDRNGYAGYKLRHDVRYQFNYQNRIKFGVTGAQDSGEPFFSGKNRWGYDHYAYYLQLRDMGCLEALNLGTFRVQMGMGMIMNTGFYLGKLASLQSLGRSTHMLAAHTSRTQSGYLRGAGATIRIGSQWKLTAFASYRALDATLNENGTARTLLTSGYHRTTTELSKKNNTHETTLGASLGYRPTLQKGIAFMNANMVYSHLDRRLQPIQSSLYQRYAAEGNGFLNASLDYGYNDSKLSIAGETALNRQGAMAMIHTVSYRLTDALTLMALHRYYDKRYTALHSRSFGEGSGIQNEHGAYLGATWSPTRSWLVQGYLDYAHFGWPRYQATAATDALDVLLAVRHTHKVWTYEGRYRLHIRQRDNDEKTMIMNRPEHRLRLRLNYESTARWSLQTQADAVSTRIKDGSYSQGLMVSQQATWEGRWFRVKANIGWFCTDDYDARIYQYEPSILHDFSFPSYYGHGLRYALTFKGDVCSKLTVEGKAGVTNYFNRSTIGSGLQEVGHSSMTDLLISLRYKF